MYTFVLLFSRPSLKNSRTFGIVVARLLSGCHSVLWLNDATVRDTAYRLLLITNRKSHIAWLSNDMKNH